jgi:hypothetical protein
VTFNPIGRPVTGWTCCGPALDSDADARDKQLFLLRLTGITPRHLFTVIGAYAKTNFTINA